MNEAVVAGKLYDTFKYGLDPVVPFWYIFSTEFAVLWYSSSDEDNDVLPKSSFNINPTHVDPVNEILLFPASFNVYSLYPSLFQL
jgi:hypothetical protein